MRKKGIGFWVCPADQLVSLNEYSHGKDAPWRFAAQVTTRALQQTHRGVDDVTHPADLTVSGSGCGHRPIRTDPGSRRHAPIRSKTGLEAQNLILKIRAAILKFMLSQHFLRSSIQARDSLNPL